MRMTKVEEMDSLAKTDRLVMKQQGKTMDRTSQYCHYHHCNRPRRRLRREEEDEDVEEAGCENRFIIQNRWAFYGAAR